MDLISDETVAAVGLLVAEACERLVDTHDQQLDKAAAMLTVETPTFQRQGAELHFDFKVKGNRQRPVATSITIAPQADEDDAADPAPLGVALEAQPQCRCAQFARDRRCPHTLAAIWWLQEQLGRRELGEALEFFSSLETDSLAAGRELVDDLLSLAEETGRADQNAPATRLQWRVRLSDARYYCPISITPYEQRPRKNGKGWTKGKEVRGYDLLRRDFFDHPVDGRVASLVATPSYSFDDDHYPEFQALRLLAGHPNVAWDDGDATPLAIHAAELSLQLQPVEAQAEDADGEPAEDAGGEPAEDAEATATRFRPLLSVSGIDVDLRRCEIVLGHSSPAEPVVVLADRAGDRLIVCTLRNPRATRLIQYLLRSDLSEVVLDADSAARLSLGGAVVDPLIRVDLPQQLAGPVEPAEAELVVELRPRTGAGLRVALAMHEERFRELLVPGQPPEVERCLTEQGPVQLRRDLASETALADALAERFELHRLNPEERYRWFADSDEAALELLGRFYSAGDDAPRLIWPEGETIRVRGEIAPSALKVQIDDRRDWFGLSGAISLDGQEVSLKDLLAAVRENRSLVQVGDRQFAKISDAFRKRLQQLGDAVIAERGALKVAEAAVPAVSELLGDDLSLEATARWHESIQRLESLADWTPEKPEQLEAQLRDYQLDGYRWMARLSQWGVGGVLADDMGLGKTVQALGVLIDRASGGPALVVAPTSVGDNWVRETQRFAPTLQPKLDRDSDRQSLLDSAGPGDLIIVSYQLLQRDAKRFASRSWHTLVLDEAQFIKNSQTKTSQAIRGLDAQWRLGLSGTPLENHLGELWSLFRTLSPGLLGSWQRFRDRFAEPIERHHDQARRESLARLMRPFILRRTKEKVLSELPPRTEITLQAELSGAERKRYEDARLAAVTELSGAAGDPHDGDKRIRTLAWLTRLRQLACHPRLVDNSWKKSSAKLDLLLSLVDELRDEGHRALVFSQFVKHLGVVRQALEKKGVRYQYLDGGTAAKERQRQVDAFQNGEADLFLISLKAGGTGLNLTAADYVIHLDPWWNPAVEDQATDRAHRIGQERPVTVYRLVAQGTIEEQILQMHADKRELVAGVLDGTDRAARMNTDDLIQLIKEGATVG